MPRGIPKNRAWKTINKMDCVRQALANLGHDATTKELQDFLKKTFNLDMDAKMLSSYKGSILKKAAGPSALIRQPAPTPPTPLKAVATNGGISVEDIRAVKELVGRIGADNVRELVDVLYE